MGQGVDTKYQDEEIECVKRPAEETRDERISLNRIQLPESSDDAHFVQSLSTLCVLGGERPVSGRERTPADASIGFSTDTKE